MVLAVLLEEFKVTLFDNVHFKPVQEISAVDGRHGCLAGGGGGGQPSGGPRSGGGACRRPTYWVN